MAELPIYDSARRPSPFIDELQQLFRYRDLLLELISRDVKVRYKRSVLGVGWTMLHPLLTVIILSIIFANLFRFSVENYPLYLLSGLLVWNLFTATTTHSMTQIIWGGGLLNRIYMPKAVFAVSSVGTGLVNIALAIIPLLLIMIATGVPLSLSLLSLPVAVMLTAVFALGISLFLSALAIYFADVLNMFEVILLIWMYATPIFYPVEIVPEQFRWIIALNPMYYYVELFRAPILTGSIASAQNYAIGTLVASITLVFGWWYFTRQADEFAYRV